jgi:hypothetical protein
MRNNAPFISNLGTSFETFYSPLQRRTINHPPTKDDERWNERYRERQRNG